MFKGFLSRKKVLKSLRYTLTCFKRHFYRTAHKGAIFLILQNYAEQNLKMQLPLMKTYYLDVITNDLWKF